MMISVVICTWNRARLLDTTLSEARKLQVPAGVDWELIVVNNDCTDHTEQVIESHRTCLPICRLFEPKQGHSNARNCAVAAAKGEVILWTDDDVLLEPDWLGAYAAATERWPHVSFFGGPVDPWFEGSPPQWLQRVWPQVSNAYAIRDLGTEPIPFSKAAFPYGANFAIRTLEQRKYLYDPTLGRNKNSMMGHDETTVFYRMLQDGLEGRWVPSARVKHYVPRERQTLAYLRRFYRGDGEFYGRKWEEDRYPKLFGRPRWLWRRALEAEMRYRWRRVFREPEVWIEDLRRSSFLWGQLRGIPRAHHLEG